jgi:gamma-glutamyltranspeptidase/glutathione hydrolase
LAEFGFPIYESLHNYLLANRQKFFERYPSTAALYYPHGAAPETGEVWRNPDYAGMLKELVAAEGAVKGKGRIAGLEAARDTFYKGEIAHRIVDFISQNPVIDATGVARTGLLTVDDFAKWYGAIEEPVSVNYRGLDVYKCPAWTQGPVFLQQLTLLEGFDLAAMGHNSADYLHTVVECAKLAFADREAYYGDPIFDNVPMEVLLSKEYAAQRRTLIEATASRELRPGDAGHGIPAYATMDVLADNRRALQVTHPTGSYARGNMDDMPDDLRVKAHLGDTTHLDAMDRAGNMVASTPSGGWIGTSPVIPGCGFPLGTRGQMFYLNAARPNALKPHKRPRATLTPSLVTRNGEPWMVFGTPGGDSQDQWTLQLFLNVVDFGMNIQEALDAPTVDSVHFPSSFYPREAFPARLSAENRIAPDVIAELRRRGHVVGLVDGWANGKCMGIRYDRDRGVILGGAAAKGNVGYAIGW